jgi:hypothetical protein
MDIGSSSYWPRHSFWSSLSLARSLRSQRSTRTHARAWRYASAATASSLPFHWTIAQCDAIRITSPSLSLHKDSTKPTLLLFWDYAQSAVGVNKGYRKFTNPPTEIVEYELCYSSLYTRPITRIYGLMKQHIFVTLCLPACDGLITTEM